MPKLAKFKDAIEHPKKNSICLLTVISIDQEYQQGDSFKAFCDLLQENIMNKRIHKLIIVETGYLKRHYIRIDPALTIEEASEKAQRAGKEWVKMHKPYLDELDIPCEIKSWKDIVTTTPEGQGESFSTQLDKIKNDYEKNDDRLKDLINTLSRSYAFKLVDQWDRKNIKLKFDTCFQAAKNYLIEEGAIIFQLIKLGADFITYPDRSNPVLKYIYKKYLAEIDPLPWKRYQVFNNEIKSFSPAKSKHNSLQFVKLQESIITTITHVCHNWDDGQIKKFYKGFITLISDINKKV